MEMNTSCTATRTDRGLPAAHGGTLLASRTRITASTASTTATNAAANAAQDAAPKAAFVGVPTYVVDQESHPPRGSCPV